MNYPIWLLENIGGGTIIAWISILHVYVSHLAVGGGIFIWLLDWWSGKKGDSLIEDFLRQYNWVFLLVTMIFGGVSGVGIWFAISLVSPQATSSLIHTFVFGWAIEYVFFIGEIAALLVYHYFFDKLPRKTRTLVAFFYALYAWLSLVVINGILSYMLTPGQWLETGNFWHGVFNPTYFPSLFFRTFATLMMAGLFAYIVGAFTRRKDFGERIGAIGLRWILVAFIGMIPSGIWYYTQVPDFFVQANFVANLRMQPYLWTLPIVSVLVLAFSFLYAFGKRRGLLQVSALLLLVLGLFWMGSFEYAREIARKPYVIGEYMYSHGILVEDEEELNRYGTLANAKWVQHRSVRGEDKALAGREIFEIQCLTCHTVGGPNDILPLTDSFTEDGVRALLSGQGKVREYMPPFIGTRGERDALAAYIASTLHDQPPFTQNSDLADVDPLEIPEFDKENADYVLLAWNNVGMRCISDCDPYFVLMDPNNTLEAQLVKRGDPPEVVRDGVTITYAAPESHRNPAEFTEFWDYADVTIGKELEPNTGPTGLQLVGELAYNEEDDLFRAGPLPNYPYRQPDGAYEPYPLYDVVALDSESGDLLASTRAVAPVSTEMGCTRCHGGGWKYDNQTGVSDQTAANILELHDRYEGTTLLADARAGQPRTCQSAECHGDPVAKVPSNEDVLDMSTAIHGFHANYQYASGADACVLCHPNHPDGPTRCLRGVHSLIGLTCVECHGELSDHAAALLKREWDKPGARELAEDLELTRVASMAEVTPRKSWGQQPDCLHCHKDFQMPDTWETYNQWTDGPKELFRLRMDNTGSLHCSACHGSPHSLYAAENPYEPNLDNVQPLQYQGSPYPIGSDLACDVCHTVVYDFSVHHDNMVRKVRNRFNIGE